MKRYCATWLSALSALLMAQNQLALAADKDVVIANTSQNPVPVVPADTTTHMGVSVGDHVILRGIDLVTGDVFRRYDPSTNTFSDTEFVVPNGRVLVVTDIAGVGSGFRADSSIVMGIRVKGIGDVPGGTEVWGVHALPNAFGRLVVNEHLTSGFIVPAGGALALSAPADFGYVLVQGYLVAGE